MSRILSKSKNDESIIKVPGGGSIRITFNDINKTCIVSANTYEGLSLTNLTLEKSYPNSSGTMYDLTIIDFAGFLGCKNLLTVTIPTDSKLETINRRAFLGCHNLTSINLPPSFKDLGGNLVFYACYNLTSIDIPSNVARLEASVFTLCTKLTTVNIQPDSKLETISTGAFSMCYNLTSIYIPSKVTTIDSTAFSFCYNLTNIKIDAANKYFTVDSKTNTIYNRDKTRLIISLQQTGTITIPASVKKIDSCAFISCTRITKIVAPGNKSFTVSNNTLYGDNQTRLIVSAQTNELSIPSTVINIDEGAFNSCRNIKSININSNSNFYFEPIQSILYTSNKQTIIYCPSEITGSVTVSVLVYSCAFMNCIKLQNMTINYNNRGTSTSNRGLENYFSFRDSLQIFPSTLTTLRYDVVSKDREIELLGIFVPFKQLQQMYPKLKENQINIYINGTGRDLDIPYFISKLYLNGSYFYGSRSRSNDLLFSGINYKVIYSQNQLIQNGLTGAGIGIALASVIYLINKNKPKAKIII